MTDHLTRVAEAVRDACAETCNEQHTIAERRPIPATICAMHIGHIDLPAIIASAPRPETVAWQPGLRPPSVFKTSDAGRQFVADYFANGLRRHDFSRYIKAHLAADFACALADGLHSMLAAAPEAVQVADYEAVIADYARLVRELDVALNGDDAARQASLCDLVAQVKSMKEDAKPAVPDGWPTEEMISAFAAEFSVYRQRETFGPAFRAALAAAPEAPQVAAARDVLAERQRQISVEGWTPEHDDEHADYKLSSAAGCYAMFTLAYPAGDPASFWPWDKSWWKPSADQRRNLIKAGALILAEIERLDRAALASAKGGA